MEITLDDKFYIERDEYSYMLIDRERSSVRVSEDGKESINRCIIGYYADVHQATQRYLRMVTEKSSEKMTLKEYVDKYEENVNRVKALLDGK
jgi:hypothetical protein